MLELSTGCLFFGPDSTKNQDTISSVDMYPHGLRLGDIIPILGEPVASELCWSSALVNGISPSITAKLYFKDDIIVTAWNVHQPQQQRLDMYMEVERITFFINEIPSYQPGLPWRGFTSQPIVQGCGN